MVKLSGKMDFALDPKSLIRNMHLEIRSYVMSIVRPYNEKEALIHYL